MAKKIIDINKHALVPKHTKLSEKAKKELMGEHEIVMTQLPKISRNDPAVISLNVKAGDIIKIERQSPTAGSTIFFRGVIDE